MNSKVCLTPGEDAYLIKNPSGGKVCLGKAPLRFSIELPFGNNGFVAPVVTDRAAVFMQLYQCGRLRNLFFDSIVDQAGVGIPESDWSTLGVYVAGFWFKGDNWMPEVPEDSTPQTLQRGIGLEMFSCERYVRCYGNPLPRQCLPTFCANENKASLTFGYDGADNGTLTINGQAVIDYGMAEMSAGQCFMDSPVAGIDPLEMYVKAMNGIAAQSA